MTDIAIIQDEVVTAQEQIDPIFRHTPQFRSDALLPYLGAAPVLKVETINPIRSFKGRGASLLTGRLRPGVEVVCASVGNFGQGMAYAAAKTGVALTVFLSEDANPQKAARIRAFGAKTISTGTDFDAAKDAAREYASCRALQFIEDGVDQAVTVGAGTIGAEMAASADNFDTLFIPVGNGALLNGVAAALKRSRPNVRIVGVCAEGAPAMALSWVKREAIRTPTVSTCAEGIAVRNAVPEAVRAMEYLADDMIMVSDEAMIECVRLCFRELGLITEPAGVAGLAALLEHPGASTNSEVATILCGGNLSDTQAQTWLRAAEMPARTRLV